MNLAEMLKQADAAVKDVDVGETEFKPLPPGTYDVAVTEAEGPLDSKRSNPNNPTEFGKLIKLKLSVVGGEHNGRTLWLRNNIIVFPVTMSQDDQRKAQMAMAMGAKERKVMLDSIGRTGIENAAELVGATFRVEVVLKPYNGKMSNEVSKVLSGNGSGHSSSVAQSAPASVASPAPAKAKLPWE